MVYSTPIKTKGDRTNESQSYKKQLYDVYVSNAILPGKSRTAEGMAFLSYAL